MTSFYSLIHILISFLALIHVQNALQDEVHDHILRQRRQNGVKQKPHLIVIVGDDIGWNDVGWHNPTMHTPFMDSLARNGTILSQFYAMPQCTPSRATLLTGIYANNIGLQRDVLLNQEAYGVPTDFTMYPKLLQDAGYQTHMFGKWHIGYCDWLYTPTYRGFDSYLGFYNGAEENFLHCVSPTYVFTESTCNGLDFNENRTSAPQYDGQFSTNVYTQRIVELIDNYNDGDKPLFMHIAITNMHFPVQSTERYANLCGDAVNTARQNFCRAMAAFDESVQNITQALINKGLYENSVIVFVSDNGGDNNFGGNNYPLRGQKSTQWEGGSRVPAFVHSPLLEKRNYTNDGLMHIADISATMLRLARAKPVLGSDGVDQWDSISKNHTSKRHDLPYLFDYRNGTYMAAIRNVRYKLMVGPGGLEDQIMPENETVDYSFNFTYFATYTNRSQPRFNYSDHSIRLFDLKVDPSESNNIATQRPDIVKQMFRILKRYQIKTKPAVTLGNDPNGDPQNFGGNYSPGWCAAYEQVPIFATQNGGI